MYMPRRSVCAQLRTALLFYGSMLVFLLILALPVMSQAIVGDRPTAPIVLDGTVLFELSDLENFTAESRAQQINDHLADALSEPDQLLRPEVVVGRSELVTIHLGKEHLLTITENDVMPGEEPLEQAQVWQRKINTALQQAKLERSPQYQRQALYWSLGVGGRSDCSSPRAALDPVALATTTITGEAKARLMAAIAIARVDRITSIYMGTHCLLYL